MAFFLGADLGGTKTHVLIADELGNVIGFGEAGPANQQTVGYAGMSAALTLAFTQAMNQAGIPVHDIVGAGLGIAGYDWPSERDDMQAAVSVLGLQSPTLMVNDAILGLVAGSRDGWGVVLVSGTGCNCRGRDRSHTHEGRVSGYGDLLGEGAGGTELVYRAMQLVAHAWTKRGAPTSLCDAFVAYVGARDLEELIEGYTKGRYHIGAAAAPLVFQAAGRGDDVARAAIRWAGCELGEMANAIIRQLGFENLAFDVVLSGSMFEGGKLLIDPVQETVQKLAPQARMLRLDVPPAIGAVLLGMEAAESLPTEKVWDNLAGSRLISRLRRKNVYIG